MNSLQPLERISQFSTPRRLAFNVLSVIAGLLLGAVVLHAAGGEMRTVISLDRERVLEQSDRCRVLVVGPSYVMGQFDEQIFDEEAQRLGHPPPYACKFGATGLRGLEVHVQLGRLLAEGTWPSLSLVVVDTTLPWVARLDEANAFHPRVIQSHTLQSIPWLLQYYHIHPEELTLAALGGRAAHLVVNYLNIGAGPDTLSSLHLARRTARVLGAGSHVPRTSIEEHRRWRERRWRRKARRNDDYQRKTTPSEHERAMTQLRADKAQHAQELLEADLLLPLREMARARGAEAVFIQAPVWRGQPPALEQPVPHDPLLFFDFNDPARYPELYEPANRGRNHHLSWAGGQVYSRLLARTVLAHARPRL